MRSFSGAVLGCAVALLVATYGLDAQQGGGGGQGAQGGQGGRGGRGGGTQDVIGGVGTAGRSTAPPKPAPRNAAGRATLTGESMADKGVWLPVFGILDPIAPAATVPFQPWAKAVYDNRQKHELEPHTRCKPSGTARQFLTPYGVEFVELPDAQRVYIFDIGGPHTFRTIYMDGRSHPADFTPTYYGHSIGWWDGDTLVVDTVGYNERFWLDRRGLPHTYQSPHHRALHAHQPGPGPLSDHRGRPGRVHRPLERAVQPALGVRHRAVRVHVPAGQLRDRADGGRSRSSRKNHHRGPLRWTFGSAWCR